MTSGAFCFGMLVLALIAPTFVFTVNRYQKYTHKKRIETARAQLVGRMLFIPVGEPLLSNDPLGKRSNPQSDATFGFITDVVAGRMHDISPLSVHFDMHDFDHVLYVLDTGTYVVPLMKLTRERVFALDDYNVLHIV